MELLKTHRFDSDGLLPQAVFAVPGINRFLGAFADLCKGNSLCAYDDSLLYIAVSKRSDFMVSTANVMTGERKKFQLNSIKYKKEDRWGNYIKGAVSILMNRIPGFSGLTITLDGYSWSCENSVFPAALAVGVINAINSIYNLGLDRKGIVFTAVSLFSSFCTEPVPCLDLIALVFGEKGKFIFLNTEKNDFTIIDSIFKDSDYELLLVDGSIPSSVMKEEIAYTAKTIESTMTHLRAVFNRSNLKDFSDSIFNDRTLPFDEDERRIWAYLLNEYKTTLSSIKLMSQKDFVGFGKAISRVQRGIRDNLELTCPEIDWLLKRAGEIPSCLGAGIVFNGLGNLISVLIKRDSVKSYCERLEEYEHIFGFRSRVKGFNPQNEISLIDLNNPALQN